MINLEHRRPIAQTMRTGVTLGCAIFAIAIAVAVDAHGADSPPFDSLPVWDDGLSEMCYYDAQTTIYGQQRSYTRVHLFNRQWMSDKTGVKTSAEADATVSVFKLNIAEEIPTQNYNYRYLTTVFLRRPGLTPFKMVTSSQEWCGTTFKHLRWRENGLTVSSFSYFDGEGDKTWSLDEPATPFEAVFVLARAVAATGGEQRVKLLGPMRGTHEVVPKVSEAVLKVEGSTRVMSVPAGSFKVKRVTLSGSEGDGWFDVEADAPYRLIAFSAGGVAGKLRFVERRAYWDRSWGSGFHKRGEAP